MDNKDDMKNVIDEFFKNASEEDLIELQRFLEAIEKNQPNKRQHQPDRRGINFSDKAAEYASDLRKRMGLTTGQINKSARAAVRTMLLQYDPFMPEEKIQMLLNMWVPDRQAAKKNIPKDILMSMISQFTAYGRGELSEAQLAGFPEGWAKKYWDFFSENIRKIIEAYIKDRIERAVFRELIEKVISSEYE